MKEASKPKYWVIIPAAGIGKRMGEGLPKQYRKLKGRPILEHTLSLFTKHPKISQVIVVLHPEDTQWSHFFGAAAFDEIITIPGGATRADSVICGLEYLQKKASPNDWVLVHDAARPYLKTATLDRLIETLQDHPIGGLLAIPVADTLKKLDAQHSVQATISRENMWAAQTPQLFRFSVLYAAMQKALASDLSVTDESSAVEFFGAAPMVVRGDASNSKITMPEDLVIAGEGKKMRIGSGFDSHAFTEGDFVMIGGVKILHTKGVRAHSDGDVLLHALGDALLGAAALGDLGRHFPDTDPAYASMDSGIFIERIMVLLQEKKYRLVNIDATVITEAPRLSSHIEKIQSRIAALVGISVDAVSVKATTNEKMGWIGRAEGLAAQAVVLIEK